MRFADRQAGRQSGRQAATSLDDSAPLGCAPIAGIAERALIVEDDALHARSLLRLLRSWGVREVALARTLAAARDALGADFGLVFFDLALPDGRSLALVLAVIATESRPVVVVVTATCTDEELCALSAAGVCVVMKPSCPHTIRAVVERSFELRADEARPLDELVDQAERRALEHALARADGNLTEVARILRVPRQRVQQLMDRHDMPRRRRHRFAPRARAAHARRTDR